MIVKVQQSQFTSSGSRQMLVYNKDSTVQFEGDLTEEVGDILGDKPKAYFEAKINAKNEIQIIKEVQTQKWQLWQNLKSIKRFVL